MSNGNGWFKFHRKIYSGDMVGKYAVITVWTYLLSEAQWSDSEHAVTVAGQQYYPKTGEVITGQHKIVKATGLARQRVRSAIAYLEKTERITQKTNFDGSVIKINNYDKYQDCLENHHPTITRPKRKNQPQTNQPTNQPQQDINAMPPNVDELNENIGQPSEQPQANQRVTSPQPASNHIKENNKLTRKEDKKLNPSRVVTGGSLVWFAYRDAYFARYKVEPVRNQRTNALCSQLAKRLGVVDAPEVIKFYLTHTDRWYVTKRHQLEYAVKDAEKLHMEWRTGDKMNSLKAKNVELQGSNDQVFEGFLRRHV